MAVLSKVAAKKTAGVLGDDLALNSQQVAGLSADDDAARREQLAKALVDPAVDLVALERDKIKGAVRTDFILSAEIIAITLGTVSGQPFGTQFAVLASIALVMTVGVYGLVAGIVKLDEAGLWLSRRPNAAAQALGRAVLVAAPWLMKALSVAGTAAMFLVGGGILGHGVPLLHHGIADAVAGLSGWAALLTSTLAEAGVGMIAGVLVLAGVMAFQRLRARPAAA